LPPGPATPGQLDLRGQLGLRGQLAMRGQLGLPGLPGQPGFPQALQPPYTAMPTAPPSADRQAAYPPPQATPAYPPQAYARHYRHPAAHGPAYPNAGPYGGAPPPPQYPPPQYQPLQHPPPRPPPPYAVQQGPFTGPVASAAPGGQTSSFAQTRAAPPHRQPAPCKSWRPATNADVQQDGVLAYYQTMLSQSEALPARIEIHNGRAWKFQTVTPASDPTFGFGPGVTKAVRGWVCEDATTNARGP